MRLYQSNIALFDHVSLNNEQLKKQTNKELKSKQEDKIYCFFGGVGGFKKIYTSLSLFYQ